MSATARLLRLLNRAGREDGSKSFLDVWANVFEIDPADRGKAYQCLGDLYRVIEAAKAEATSHRELKEELYLGTIARIEKILTNAQPHGSWRDVSRQLAGERMRSLEFCADQIDRLSSELEIQADYLTALRKEVEILIDDLMKTDLDTEVKGMLLARLEDLRAALIAYGLRGIDGLRLATQSAVGALVIAYPKLGQHSKVEAVQKFVRLMIQLVTLAEKARQVLPSAGDALKAFLSSGKVG